MAPRIERAARRHVSYREASFEEDDEDESFEETEDVESDASPPQSSNAPFAKRRTARSAIRPETRRKAKVSYKEESSEQEDSEASHVEHEEAPGHKQPVKKLSAPLKPASKPRLPGRQSRNPKSKPRSSARRGAPKKQKLPKATASVAYIPTDGVCPDLSTLPYEILRTIFSYAAHPLQDPSGRPTPSVGWLLQTCCMCQRFEAPALHALYTSPPITSALRGHGLIRLLSQPRPESAFAYSTKVRRLDVEVNVLAHAATGLGHLDLSALIPHLPRLTEINIWDRDDDPQGRIYGHRSSRWLYNERLLNIITATHLNLISWHWNAKFIRSDSFSILPSEAGPSHLERFHSSASCSHLRELKLSRFSSAAFAFAKGLEHPSYYDSRWPQFIEFVTTPAVAELFDAQVTPVSDGRRLAEALCLLPRLENLTFHHCGINSVWLQYLSTPLQSLQIIDCHEVDATGFERYLSLRGSHLRELVLNHNLALSLSFLPTLKVNCPKLQVLKMDLTYRSSLVASNDASEPEYIDLIGEDEKPAWPSTLRSIELLHLRRWTRSAAELFLSSLIQAAPQLPDLRRLVLSCSISISWRERAAFRDNWISRFQRVFLRRATPPSPHLASLRAWRERKQRGEADAAALAAGIRRFSHIAISPRKRPFDATDNQFTTASDSDGPATRKRRRQVVQPDGSDSASTRQLRPRRSARADVNDNDGEQQNGASGSSLRDVVMQALETHVQGLCDVVDIRIDNLRPTENQLTEGDFLDEEPSGDDDWKEENDEDGAEDGNGYAW